MTRRSALALRHVAFEDVGVWAETLDAAGCDLAYVEVGPRPLPLDRLQACDLLIVLGAPIGVYETAAYPFLVEEIGQAVTLLLENKWGASEALTPRHGRVAPEAEDATIGAPAGTSESEG